MQSTNRGVWGLSRNECLCCVFETTGVTSARLVQTHEASNISRTARTCVTHGSAFCLRSQFVAVWRIRRNLGVQCYDTLSSRAAGALLSTVRVTDGSLLLNRLLFTPLEEARAEAKGNEPMFLTSSYCYTRMFLLPLVVLCPVNQSVSLLGYLQIGVKQVIKKHCSSKGNFHPPVQ